ncbi:hypothetical protein LCGC14_0555630 [marine sediment metagenome]|uniref:Thioredoxin-like fold domain-containing protein n=1 Tax=marine sediment metagenome TaxID=412755 RepID=A0A0F9S759_9ZZZZ
MPTNKLIASISKGGLICVLLVVIALLLSLNLNFLQTLTPPHEPPLACRTATPEQAENLLRHHFPDLEIIDISAQPKGTADPSCLLSVELLANAEIPSTRGFVYVLPDGEHFLNGPLMNRSSNLSTIGDGAKVPVLSDEDAKLSRDLEVLSKVAEMIEAGGVAVTSSPDSQETAIDTLIGDMSGLPNQIIFHSENKKPVYIAFDPMCMHCQKLFADQEQIATRFGARLVWIPTYSTGDSQTYSAHLIKALNSKGGMATARDLMAMIMGNPTIDVALLNSLFGEPSERDFARLEESAAYLRAMMGREELGTPLVAFKTGPAPEDSTLFNGYAPIEDFGSLLNY